MTEIKQITEGSLQFSFPQDWQIVKFDDTAWYRKTIKSRVKSMDILARRDDTHWWIEIKDCVGYEAENLPRLSATEPGEVTKTRAWIESQNYDGAVRAVRKKPFLVDEVAEKLEGTLLSLLAAQRAESGHSDAAEVRQMAEVALPAASWSMVLVLCWNPRDFNRLAVRLGDKLTQRLSAYQVRCFVLNEQCSVPVLPWRMARISS